MKNLQKSFVYMLIIVMAASLQFCRPTQASTTSSKAVAVSYEKQVKPIMVASCTPCHFPETGKKKMLDTYAATKESIDDIIKRVQLLATDEEFMPFKSKKPALTTAEIQVLKDWVAQGMAE